MDLFNGEIISYQLKQRPTFDLVEDILKEAMGRLQLDENQSCILIKVGSIK